MYENLKAGVSVVDTKEYFDLIEMKQNVLIGKVLIHEVGIMTTDKYHFKSLEDIENVNFVKVFELKAELKSEKEKSDNFIKNTSIFEFIRLKLAQQK